MDGWIELIFSILWHRYFMPILETKELRVRGHNESPKFSLQDGGRTGA